MKVVPRGNEQLAFPSHQERYDTSRPLPPDKKFTLIVEATIRCVVLHQCVVDSKFIKYPSVVIVRGKTIIGPQSFSLSLRPRRRSTKYVANDLLSEFTAFSDECFISALFCRMFNFGGINAEYFHLRRHDADTYK